MVWSCKMPSDIMEQSHASTFYKPSAFSEEMRLPSEKQFGLWQTASMPDHRARLSSNDVFLGQSVNAFESNILEDEAFESLEEIEAQTIGDLLPDDDDLLSGAIHDLGYVSKSNITDFEDDLFYSVGGLELESDDNFSCKKGSEYSYRGAFTSGERGFHSLPASELQSGEQLTRTLLVKNINSSINDIELRTIFEQYGDVRTLYTLCIHRGFMMVSYYDIRAAQNAMRVLQTKSIKGQKLDIQFCISKQDNPLEADTNEGVLMVTNLDPSVSNDDVLHIFGVYGEIKEICEIPRKQHCRSVEFYDIRKAAFSALNTREIAGKRIKVEPCGPRDTKFRSTRCLSVDLEDEDSSRRRRESYSQNLPSECFVSSGLMTLGENTSRVLHNGDVQGVHASFEMQNRLSSESKFHEIPSSSPHKLSSPARVALLRNFVNQSGNFELSHSLGHMNLGFQSMPTLPHGGVTSGVPLNSSSTVSAMAINGYSLGHMNLGFQSISTLPRDGVTSGVALNSPSTMSAMAVNVSSTLSQGVDNRNMHRVGSGGHSGHSFEHTKAAFNVSGNGKYPLHENDYTWSSSNSYHHQPGSMMWQNLSPFMNNSPAQSPTMHGFTRAPAHINPVLPHRHVGSAPTVDPLLWNQRHSLNEDATAFHPSALENMGFSSFSELHSLELASRHIFPHSHGTCVDPSIASAHIGVPSPQQKSHMFHGRNRVNQTPNLHDITHDRMRRRISDSGANQADSKKQYELDINRIIQGDDSRTTLMIKNIPNKYTSKMLLGTIDDQHKGTYDFIYLPIDFKNKCNVGYAFINMTDPQHIISFYQAFNGKKWEKFNSEKVAYLAYARIQGKAALINHFQNSSLMNEDKRCRPIIFRSDGPNAGDQEPFPVGVNVRSRRSKTNSENHQESASDSSGDESSNPSSSSASAKNSE
ncbi:protein MEI2-like 4 isoform X1 [Asparagus officinalis]|uniref:protein MEI2-like 4 isoform X1 n=1 Tax=Asparagus officinalis TaxID=4686 RepID=UPI00098E8660|nr:protein MEI2-like 4 isoform X1 [Asparagus officinalis]